MLLNCLIGITRLFFLDKVYYHSDQVRNRFGARELRTRGGSVALIAEVWKEGTDTGTSEFRDFETPTRVQFCN